MYYSVMATRLFGTRCEMGLYDAVERHRSVVARVRRAGGHLAVPAFPVSVGAAGVHVLTSEQRAAWIERDRAEQVREGAEALGGAERSSAAGARFEELLAGPMDAARVAESAVALQEAPVQGLDARALLSRMRLADAVARWAQAQAAAALGDLVGERLAGEAGEQREKQLRLEVRVARRCSDDAAGRDIAEARMLAAECRPVRDLLESGAITSRHVWAVLDRVSGHRPEVVAGTVVLVAPRLALTPSQKVRALVSRAIATVDSAAQADRVRSRRRHGPGVRLRDTGDGLADLVVTLRVEDARACLERIDTDADAFLSHLAAGCEQCDAETPAEIGPARAAVASALLLGRHVTGDPASPDAARGSSGSARRRRGELQVVVSLQTLLGLDENPGEINGVPVPAEIARELAAGCGSMRRLVTDDIGGYLLDYGDRQYLPEPLRDFLVARDRTCRGPGCGQPAYRSQHDHVIPFPLGPSSADNGHMACKRDHDLKTTGYLRLRDNPDGTRTWITGLGQEVATAPEPYLPDLARGAAAPRHDDPPPF